MKNAHHPILLSALSLLLFIAHPAHAASRTWTDSTGSFKVEAELVGVAAGMVTLKKTDGQVIRVPFNRLSADDQDFLRTGSGTSGGNNWPQWRGPDRTDISKETGLLKEWPEGGPERLWLNEEGGKGYGGFAVVGGKLYTMGLFDAEEKLLCLDAETGEQQWELLTGPIFRDGTGDGPRSTPTVTAEAVYAIGARGNVVCASLDGKLVWKTSMVDDLGGKVPQWGYTESPLVDGKHVVVTPGGSKGAIAALDKNTGRAVWQSDEFTDGAQYSSLFPVDHGGKRQYIQLVMRCIVGVSASNGDVLWRTEFPGATAVVPTPIYKDGHVYVSAGYGVGCKMVKLGGAEPREMYSNKVMVNHHGGVVLVGDHLYGHSDNGGWKCQNFMTGEEVWASTALGKGSLTVADGMLYCLGEDGTMALAEVSTSGWNEKGRFKLQASRNGGRVWVHPVVCNGRLYLRDMEQISCYDIKGR